MADRRAVKQIFVNLLSNAVKFTPDDGQGHGARARCCPTQIVLMIADTGIGIAPRLAAAAGQAVRAGREPAHQDLPGLGPRPCHRAVADQPARRNDAAALETRHRHRGPRHAAARGAVNRGKEPGRRLTLRPMPAGCRYRRDLPASAPLRGRPAPVPRSTVSSDRAAGSPGRRCSRRRDRRSECCGWSRTTPSVSASFAGITLAQRPVFDMGVEDQQRIRASATASPPRPPSGNARSMMRRFCMSGRQQAQRHRARLPSRSPACDRRTWHRATSAGR